MDSNNSTNAADLGSNVDSAPATLDNHGTNLDFIFTYNDDPSFHTGESSSQPSVTHSREHLRCVNCGLNVSRLRRHLLKIADVRIRQQWVRQQAQVSSDSVVCHSCWTAA